MVRFLPSIAASLPLGSALLIGLLASGQLQAANISAAFKADSTWNAGYTGTLTIANAEKTAVSDWQASLQSPNPITGSWNATLSGGAGGAYTLVPADWTKTIAPGGSIAIGFTFDGQQVLPPSRLVFNGQTVPITTTAPPPGATPTPPGSGAPGTPTISVQQNWTNGGFDVTWAVYSGGAATAWKLLEDGVVYHTGATPAVSNGQQTLTYHIGNRPYSAHSYQVVISNAAGSRSSAKQAYLSDGASAIGIGPADAPKQARRVTVPYGHTSRYTLSLVDSSTGKFELASNNDAVCSYAMADARTLAVTGKAPGRASLRITNALTKESRWLGVRVGNPDNTIPGLPNYVSVGSVSEDSSAYLDYWRGFGAGDNNRRVDIRYIYLNDGPSNKNPNNWYNETNPHGFRVTSYVRESQKLGMIPFFVWYNINGTGDGPDALDADFHDASFMQGYFTDLKTMLALVEAEAGGDTVGIVLEPDSLGYLVQLRNVRDPNAYAVRVDAAYTAGVLKHGEDPEFPNTVKGYVQAVNYIISKNYPPAVFGWEFALWASPPGGWAIPNYNPGLGLMHQTDSLGITQGRKNVAREAAGITDFYVRAGVASYGASFVSVDKYGEDAGFEGPGDPAATHWFWNETQWINYLTFADAMAVGSHLPVVLWQIPIGHINSSLSRNPAGGSFPSLANTSGCYEDSAGTFFFGDSFKPGAGKRQTFFSMTDPLGKVTASGETVTWTSAMDLAASHGVRAILFGPGVGVSTQLVPQYGGGPYDGNWWITQVQRYLQHPVPLDGTSPLPNTSGVEEP